MEPLYHYCSNAAFLGTIHSKKIWLSMLSLSNDTSEGTHVREVMGQLIGDDDQREELQAFFDKALSQHIAGFGYCLSPEGDQLSQWRGYADDGAGVAIGYDRGTLSKLATSQAPHPMSLVPVLYTEEEKAAKLGPIVTDLMRLEGVERTLRLLDLAQWCYVMKHDFFAEEREERLISVVDMDLDWQRLENCKFTARTQSIVPIMELPIEGEQYHPIERVVLGPKNRTPERVVEALLDANGFPDVEIVRSRGPYV